MNTVKTIGIILISSCLLIASGVFVYKTITDIKARETKAVFEYRTVCLESQYDLGNILDNYTNGSDEEILRLHFFYSPLLNSCLVVFDRMAYGTGWQLADIILFNAFTHEVLLEETYFFNVETLEDDYAEWNEEKRNFEKSLKQYIGSDVDITSL